MHIGEFLTSRAMLAAPRKTGKKPLASVAFLSTGLGGEPSHRTRESLPPAGTWLVIAGNLLWVAASLVMLFLVSPTGLGYAFVIAQAIIVGALAELEYLALRRLG